MILIASKHKDFTEVVSQQVERAFNVPCVVKHTTDNLNQLDSGIKIVVTDAPVDNVTAILVTPDRIPFRINEIFAKIQDALQVGTDEGAMAILNGYTLSPRTKLLTHLVSGKQAALTDKEIQLLSAIHQAGKAGVERDELLKAVWGVGPDVNTHTLETHVYRLRAKFRELSGADEGIETTDGKYRLAA